MPSPNEILAMADAACRELERVESGSKRGCYGLRYEEGVRDALEWACGRCDGLPVDGGA